MWLSIIALSSECADVIAWKSPVKCRFISSIGTTLRVTAASGAALHAEVRPKRRFADTDSGVLADAVQPSPRPTVVVVLPSPAGVGLIAVTRISLPSVRSWTELMNDLATPSLCRGRRAAGRHCDAQLCTDLLNGFLGASRAIWMSVL